MKATYLIPVFFLLTLVIVSCEKEVNEQPHINFTAGSPTYKSAEHTYYQFKDDTLFKITESTKENISYVLVGNDLSTGDLDVSNMFSDALFPAMNNAITCQLGEAVTFGFAGEADGIVIYYGDSTSKASQIYADYPYAKGVAISLNTDDQTGSVSYSYAKAGTYQATMVARNFWRTNEPEKEQDEIITVVVLENLE